MNLELTLWEVALLAWPVPFRDMRSLPGGPMSSLKGPATRQTMAEGLLNLTTVDNRVELV